MDCFILMEVVCVRARLLADVGVGAVKGEVMLGLWNAWLVEDEVGEEFGGEGGASFILQRCKRLRSRGWYWSEATSLLPHTAAGRSVNTMAGAVTPSVR